MNSLDEVQSTCFQIPPEVGDYFSRSRVVYCHQAFSLSDVQHISEVYSEDRGVYKMFVTISTEHHDKKLEFKFDMRTTAIKAQRELWRAYTRTGEFTYVREDKSSTKVAVRQDSSVGDS